MAGFTNRGKFLIMDSYFRSGSAPSPFYVALVTSASAPGASKNTFSELVEIANGNGYASGGASIARDDVDFDVMTEDDSASRAYLEIVDVAWTASGGNLPATGDGARYAVLLDSASSVSARQVIAFWDLSADRTVSNGQTLTLQNLRLELREE